MRIIEWEPGMDAPPLAGGGVATMDAVGYARAEHAEALNLAAADRFLISQLRDHMERQETGRAVTGETYLNAELAGLIKESYTASDLSQLEWRLQAAGTFDIPVHEGVLEINGQTKPNFFIAAVTTGAQAAAETSGNAHIDMVDNVYERDNYQYTRTLMHLHLSDPVRYAAEGALARQLLQSELDRMSSPHQLKRIDDVIARGSAVGQLGWPNITLRRSDLAAKESFDWRHIQDSAQMLADLTLEALQEEFIKPSSLQSEHRELLGRMAAFIERAGFPNYASSGSWEEVAAKSRTSVLAVETSMFARVHQLMQSKLAPSLHFLAEGYARHTGNFDTDFAQVAKQLMLEGLYKIGQQLPHESAATDQPEVCRRKADAALVYLHLYHIPKLLAQHRIPIAAHRGHPMKERMTETLIDDQLDTLIDPFTGAMKRYNGDSYQRVNWHTNLVQAAVRGLKQRMKAIAMVTGQAEIDLNEKQQERDKIVPEGREAMWPHPRFQRGTAAAHRMLQEIRSGNMRGAAYYQKLATKHLNGGLRSVTGHHQYHAALQRDKTYALQPTPAWKIPESLNTYTDVNGSFVVASPHLLNWAVACARETVGILRIATELSQKRKLGRTGLGS